MKMKSPPVHDRLAETPFNATVRIDTVDDPYGSVLGEKVRVLRSLRDDPVGALHAAGQIEYYHYLVARHWQSAYQIAEVGGARAIDPTREAVDGGLIPEFFTDQKRKALGDLFKAKQALGEQGNILVHDVLANGMTIRAAALKRGAVAERDRLYIGRRFRECLETLALLFGYLTSVTHRGTNHAR